MWGKGRLLFWTYHTSSWQEHLLAWPSSSPHISPRISPGQITPLEPGSPSGDFPSFTSWAAAAPRLFVLSFFCRMYSTWLRWSTEPTSPFLLDVQNTQNALGDIITTGELSDRIVCHQKKEADSCISLITLLFNVIPFVWKCEISQNSPWTKRPFFNDYPSREIFLCSSR